MAHTMTLLTHEGKTSPRRREAGGTAVGRVARARRDGRASSEARSHGVGPSRRPLRCCCCPSRAYWTPPVCCTQVAETKLVKHNHQDRCMLEMRLGHHEPLVRGGPGQAQLARHARARRRGQNASWAAHNPHLAAQGELVSLVFGVGQLVPHLENGLLKIFRLVCAARRRRLRAAGASGAGRRAGLLTIHMLLHKASCCT